MNKNLFLFCFLILSLTGCADSNMTGGAALQPDESQVSNLIQESAALTDQEINWQTAYMEIIHQGGGHLPDPYQLRGEDGLNSSFYLGIHDFNGDGIPELILGDGISISVYTYLNHGLEKVADLYEPEGWYLIHELYIQNNCLILVSNGSDGCGYVGFTYRDGSYLTGTYNDSSPDQSVLGGEESGFKEFNDVFHITELKQDNRKSFIKRNKERGEFIPDWAVLVW
ncbi:hypothetical protein BXY41_104375 [Lacrimispora xylanisolvens]|uniref:VCBS repeat protein n=1 Tax=Lacrimispora xylanisolvens TaxID=384636 RepID=A0A2S6HUZ7_9FIRM|nr:hypothetical protein [Hungatella xylanolytica]PPK81572.1 hypothetical protein BXY41_104375 [Hungatella xylanolytica]